MESPHQTPPATRLHRVFEVLAAAGVIGCIAPLAFWWNALPRIVPVHFGLDGNPDGYGSRGTFVVVAAVAIILYASLTVLARFPWVFNYPPYAKRERWQVRYATARTLLAGSKAFMTLVFAWTLWGGVQTALGRASGLGPWVIVVIAVYLVGLVGFTIAWSLRLKKLPPVSST